MKNRTSRYWSAFLLVSIAVFGMIGSGARLAIAQTRELSPRVLDQIRALQEEKAARTPTQRKISSHLLYALKMHRREPIARGVPTLRSDIVIAPDETVLMDITARVTDVVLRQIKALGGKVLSSFPQYQAIRARLPLTRVETLANLPEVKSIRPADEATTNKLSPPQPTPLPKDRGSFLPGNMPPSRVEREATVRARLREALPRFAQARAGSAVDDGPMTNVVNTSQGDVAHRADLARSTFGVTGAGIRIGVLSDGVDTLASRQATGDLPATVTVLAGQAGSGDEGTAMLEIVHDLAPGAALYFATAHGGQEQFAANILALEAAGCDIIVDDVLYPAEPVFQDGIIAQAVNTVTATGALYFSSAGNAGNKNDNTSGVWEGDFVAATATINGFPGHTFSGADSFANTITVDSPSNFTLQWSDASGASGNDYDLLLVNAAHTTILAASTSVQDGNDNPFEFIGSSVNHAGNVLIILKFSGAARYLHLSANRGRLTFNTSGQIWGHKAAVDAFSVAAVNVATASGGTFVGGASNPVETYSSDGPRRVFYTENGTAITPGNFLSTGGAVRQKPDIAAADCVETATPGFNPFCGTSAAAPHAAAIAALMLEANPSLATAEVRTAFKNSALDIEATGVDRDSGVGIIDAFRAVANACIHGLTPATQTMNASGGTGNTVGVGASSGCLWTAVSNAPSWITVTDGSMGTGSGTVTYSVGVNPGPNARRGTMTIAGKTFIVSQETPVPASCTITIPSGRSVGGSGGSYNLAVTASTGSCAWTAKSSVPWITITSGASGTGSGTVRYTVPTNPGPGPRAGRIIVNGKRFTVTQAFP